MKRKFRLKKENSLKYQEKKKKEGSSRGFKIKLVNFFEEQPFVAMLQ